MSTFSIANPDSASFARPADTAAYASGDLVANNTVAASVTALSWAAAARASAGAFVIKGARIRKSTTTVANASFRVHFFTSSPLVPTNGDNGVFVPANTAGYVGYVDVTVGLALTDGASGYGAAAGDGLYVRLPSGTALYGLIEARAAYAPGSAETFIVTPALVQA